MANKIKKLCKKAKKGLKNIVSRKAKGQKAKPKPLHSIKQPLQSLKPTIEEKISEVKDIKKDKKRFRWVKEKIKELKTKPVEKKGNMFKNGFKKLKGKVKKLNPIKSKKNKIIGSKKLAFLLTAGTIVGILPMFNLAPLPALAITSACVFSINFVVVKTLKKVIKQRKAKSKAVAESEKPQEEIQDVSIESVKKDPERISRE